MTPPLPNSIALALFCDIMCGSLCPSLKMVVANMRGKDVNAGLDDVKDRCIELVTVPPDPNSSARPVEPKHSVFVVEEASDFTAWMDGLKAVFNKPLLMAEEDIKALVGAQMTKRMFDLNDVEFDPTPPPVPARPPNYDFRKQ